MTQQEIFNILLGALRTYDKRLVLRTSVIDSKAKGNKKQYHLYGKKEVSIIEGRRPQPSYFAGIIMQKGYVGFYFMSIYSHPKEFKLSPEFKKMVKGKCCFHVKNLNPAIKKEIKSVLKKGYEIYKREGWI